MLAPLNGMIAAGIDDMMSNGESHVTLWKWESGIANNSTGIAPPPPTIQGEPSMNSSSNTTTTTTNNDK
jgi:hypothetical protein